MRLFPSSALRIDRVAHRILAALSLATLAAGGCSRDFINYAELRSVTETADYLRLPVVFVPGIKGTRLIRSAKSPQKSQKTIWGYSGHVAGFSGFRELALDYEELADNDMTRFGRHYAQKRVYSGEVLMGYKIGWKGFSFHDYVVYRELRNLLLEEGRFVDRGTLGGSVFLQPYDWRLDNRIAAVRLALALPVYRAQYERIWLEEFCARLRRQACVESELSTPVVREQFTEHVRSTAQRYPQFFTGRSDKPEIRFHIIAHSMGGLIGQYFLTQLGGSRDAYSFVTLGTPSKGAADALRALIEGEYPDTLVGDFLGILFEKRSTNAITASFPATFQLLPRYRGAVDGVDLADLGLRNAPAQLSDKRLEQIVRKYEEFEALPRSSDVWRALGRKIDAGIVQKHFRTQLLSAACFHAALDGDTKSDDVCKEQDRVRAAVEFLRKSYAGRERDVLGLEIADETLTSMRQGQTRIGEGAERRIVYGGHCNETTTRARFDQDSRKVTFLGSQADGGAEAAPKFYGDGRVPFESAQFKRPNEKWAASFFLCADHVDLVKDDSFKYNLLRTLLSHWEYVE